MVTNRDLTSMLETERQTREEERANFVLVERELQSRINSVLTEYKDALIREEVLIARLLRNQVRCLTHLINSIHKRHHVYFFHVWRQYANDMQTLAAAEVIHAAPVQTLMHPSKPLANCNTSLLTSFLSSTLIEGAA